MILPRRGLANRIWRPSLFLDDDALLKPSSWINDPWWHKYPELRPLDLATVPWTRPPSNFRSSYLSPIKRTYVWGYRHPLRPFGKTWLLLSTRVYVKRIVCFVFFIENCRLQFMGIPLLMAVVCKQLDADGRRFGLATLA